MQKDCRHQLSVAKWTDCWDLNIDLESNKINLSISSRTKATAVYFGLSKRWRGTEKVNMFKHSHEFLYNPWTIKSDIFCFVLLLLLLLFFFQREHQCSTLVSVKVQKWLIKMMHLYKDDHIEDAQSTCRGSCNTRMECWWLSTSSTLGSFWYSTSLSALCTQWGKTRYFCPPLPSCCVSCGPDRHVPKTKATPFTGSPPPRASTLSARRQLVCLSVQSSINTVCVFFLCWCVLQCSSSV